MSTIPFYKFTAWGVGALAAVSLKAQEPVPPKPAEVPAEFVGAKLFINEITVEKHPGVKLLVTALKNGQAIEGLKAEDFRVREDEVDQAPITVEKQLPPLSVVVALDTSGSMSKDLANALTAAEQFFGTLSEQDAVKVLSFARDVKADAGFMKTKDAAGALKNLTARGDTALYDALYESVISLKDRPGRKAVVLLSDGVDDDGTGKQLSRHNVAEVINIATRDQVSIFTVGLGAEVDKGVLSGVAEKTGGAYLTTQDSAALAEIYKQVGKQLAGQYAISYTSSLPSDGVTHRVRLDVAGLTANKEYLAPSVSSAPAVPAVPTPGTAANGEQKMTPEGGTTTTPPAEGDKKPETAAVSKPVALDLPKVPEWLPLPPGTTKVMARGSNSRKIGVAMFETNLSYSRLKAFYREKGAGEGFRLRDSLSDAMVREKDGVLQSFDVNISFVRSASRTNDNMAMVAFAEIAPSTGELVEGTFTGTPAELTVTTSKGELLNWLPPHPLARSLSYENPDANGANVVTMEAPIPYEDGENYAALIRNLLQYQRLPKSPGYHERTVAGKKQVLRTGTGVVPRSSGRVHKVTFAFKAYP